MHRTNLYLCDLLGTNRSCSVAPENPPEELYVITSDKEQAIRNGLADSNMAGISIHEFCGLHAAWSKLSCVVVCCIGVA